MLVNGTHIRDTYAEKLRQTATMVPEKSLAFILFGTDPASEKFVERKIKFAEHIGVRTTTIRSEARDTDEAIRLVQKVAGDAHDGIVVQLPLPHTLDTEAVLKTIPSALDVDMLNEASKIAFKEGRTKRMPPVAYAVHTILSFHHIELKDKDMIILGTGKLVGEPVAELFDTLHLSYKTIDIHTPEDEKQKLLLLADILISGIGRPHSIKPEMIKDGVILIDAGTSEQTGKLAGDIDPACAAKASLYTPVPGGVGPLTVLGLFNNLFLK
jgi:methylenetetrahydrofolate dehydrogenase (NADP+) / methenyltetrahydrofolate cyclohydrolase